MVFNSQCTAWVYVIRSRYVQVRTSKYFSQTLVLTYTGTYRYVAVRTGTYNFAMPKLTKHEIP